MVGWGCGRPVVFFPVLHPMHSSEEQAQRPCPPGGLGAPRSLPLKVGVGMQGVEGAGERGPMDTPDSTWAPGLPRTAGWRVRGRPSGGHGARRGWHTVRCRPYDGTCALSWLLPRPAPPGPAPRGGGGRGPRGSAPTSQPGAARAVRWRTRLGGEFASPPACAASLRPLGRMPGTLRTQVTEGGTLPRHASSRLPVHAHPASAAAPQAPRSPPADPQAALGKFAPGRPCTGRRRNAATFAPAPSAREPVRWGGRCRCTGSPLRSVESLLSRFSHPSLF